MKISRRQSLAAAALLAAPLLPRRVGAATRRFTTAGRRLQVVELAGGLDFPWGLAFLPDGGWLATERSGALRRIARDGRVSPPLSGVPTVAARGQGGLLDIALHPDFTVNGLIYLTYAAPGDGGQGTAAAYGRFDGDGLSGLTVIFRQTPLRQASHHFGSRLAFAPDGRLFITTGDRGDRDQAQNLGAALGKVIRLTADGGIPPDNPFVDRPGVRPEIWSYGHRNLQGAAIHPKTGALWTHEHGAMGGDEVNISRKGRNYGWPVITHGVDYSGAPIGEGKAKAGMEPPLHYWVPSIAPSGMAFYQGDAFPDWRGDLLVGSLKFGQVARLTLDGERVVGEERLLDGLDRRVRDVRVGPDGLIYLLTDHSDGQLLRVEPA